MKRWIIRSFFIGLLLLCVGGWVGSYEYRYHIAYGGHYKWFLECNSGSTSLTWYGDAWTIPWKKGWSISAASASGTDQLEAISMFGGHNYLGFTVVNKKQTKFIYIPFWFPSAVSAILLWWVWQKTRPKVKGRAFPVEVKEPSGR